jgi:hypothetical protein
VCGAVCGEQRGLRSSPTTTRSDDHDLLCVSVAGGTCNLYLMALATCLFRNYDVTAPATGGRRSLSITSKDGKESQVSCRIGRIFGQLLSGSGQLLSDSGQLQFP